MSSVPQLRAAHALAAAPLRPVEVDLGALGVAAAGDGDDDVLFGDQVLDGHVAVVGDDLGAPVVAELGRRSRPAPRTTISRCRSGEARIALYSRMWAISSSYSSSELLALQGGQLAQLHVEDGAGLDLVDLEQAHQALLRGRRRVAGPDQRDHGVDRVDGLEQGGQDVRPLLGLAQQVLVRRTMTSIWCVTQYRMNWSSRRVRGTPSTRASMFAPKVSCSWVCLYRLFSTTLATASRLRTMTRRWPARLLLSSRTSAMPATRPSLDQLGDLQGQVVRVDLERQLGDDQAGAALDVLLDLDDGAHGDRAAPGARRRPGCRGGRRSAPRSGSPGP